MSRPRLLYVPIAAAMESERFSALVDWAEVASFDAPGAGARRGEEPRGVAGIVDAGVERLDALGWERCGIVADSHAQAAAIELALAHPDRVEGVFLGHAAARYTVSGPRPAITPALHDAAAQLLETDYRSFARAITQLTQGLVDHAWVDAWTEQVPQAVADNILRELADTQPELVTRLRGTQLPVVLAKHEGCVMWTTEAFEDAVAAVPGAHVVSCDGIPPQEAAFLDVVRRVSSGAAFPG